MKWRGSVVAGLVLALAVAGGAALAKKKKAKPEPEATAVSSAALSRSTVSCEIEPRVIERASGVKVYVAPDFEARPPERIAVLPFSVAAKAKGEESATLMAYMLTTTFRNHFTQYPFADIEWEALRRAMERLGLSPDEPVPPGRYRELAAEVGADSLVVGSISSDSTYLLVAAKITLGMDIRIIRATTGCTLWRARHKVSHHEGGIPTSPLGILFQAVQTAMSINDKARLAVCDDIVRQVVAEIPVPPAAASTLAAQLLGATHSFGEGAARSNDEIRFSIVVNRELAGVRAEVGDGQVTVPLESGVARDGSYVYGGRYIVRPGDDMLTMPVRYIGVDQMGFRFAHVDPSGPITIDTIPPDAPSGLRARYLDGKMLLTWSAGAATDVMKFEVSRSSTPRTGFNALFETEFNRAVDETPLQEDGYYRVTAIDIAGNQSPVMPAAVGRYIKPGPTPAGSLILADEEWFAAASPYIVSSTLTIADGATLTIEPGTAVRLGPEASVVVEGRVVAEARANRAIIWEAESDSPWQGISVANSDPSRESVFVFNRFANAMAALSVSAAESVVSDNLFIRNDIGLRIRNNADPRVQRNTFRNGRIGVQIDAAEPQIEGNEFRLNQETAIEIIGSIPTFSGNSFEHNPMAVRLRERARGAIIEATHNWWGSVEDETIRKSINGPVNFHPFLDGPPPEGKPYVKVAEAAPEPEPPVPEPAPATEEDKAEQAARNIEEGVLLAESGETDRAIEMLEKAVPEAERNPLLFNNLALLYFEAGRYQDALGAIDRALVINRYVPNFHLSRGHILRATGDLDGARLAFERVLKLQPRNRNAKRLLAQFDG